ncbi:MAG: cell division protein FtsZ [Elusimicrobia bacterium]|nr:cell division protein FtsZ [Candidatus Liberimonas magnetica]
MKINISKDSFEKYAVIKVLGVGGGGSNAVSCMFNRIIGVEFFAINTDAQALAKAFAGTKVHIGEKLTKGLGVGGNPEIGRQAAEESKQRLTEILAQTDLVFITAGMGGGTGTGGAPVIASIARSLGVLSIGIVTKPFKFEGRVRAKQAENGIMEMKQYCDATIVIPNEKIIKMCDNQMDARNAFKYVDDVLHKIVKSVSEIITKHGMINRDMADLRSILKNSGEAFIGMGESSSQSGRAAEAAMKALSNPLLEDVTINGAGKILVTIFGGMDVTIGEIEEAMDIVHARVSSDAHIFYGQVLDPELHGTFKIAVVATDFASQDKEVEKEKKLNEEEYWKQPAFKIWKPRKLI